METEHNIQDYEKLIESVSTEVFCVFKTNLADKYKIPEDRYTINSNMTDRELNQFINKLIQAENDLEEETSYNFEFLFKNDFIRGTLRSHLIKHQVSAEEETIEIFYCFALEKPKLTKTIQEEDWVWDISKFDGLLNEKGYYGVAHFDGSVAIFNENSQRISKYQITEEGAVRALRIIPSKAEGQEDCYYVLTGSADEKVRVGWLKTGKKMRFEPKIEATGHEGSVECLDVDPVNSNFFATGGIDKNLRIWKFDHQAVETEESKKGAKKVKQQVESMQAQTANEIHLDEITKLIWARSETIITGSQDHTIKLFDTVKMRESMSFDCKDNAVTALTHHDNIIISGHEDAYIKAWDERSSNKQPIKILKAHSKWISSAKFHPNNPLIFTTGSYDSTVKLWDFRSTFPLINLKDQKEKVFSVEWNGDSQFLSGGSDSKIMCYDFQGQGN